MGKYTGKGKLDVSVILRGGRITREEGATSTGMGKGGEWGKGSKELAFWACLVFFPLVVLLRMISFLFYPPIHPLTPTDELCGVKYLGGRDYGREKENNLVTRMYY